VSNLNKFVDVNSLEMPEYCSLYRAVRWVAFKEPPIEECYSSILYLDRWSIESHRHEVTYNEWYEHHIVWENLEDGELFEEALNAVIVHLISKKITAYGKCSLTYKDIYAPESLAGNNELGVTFFDHESNSAIDADLWSSLNVDAYKSSLCGRTKSLFSDSSPIEIIDITVSSKDIERAFAEFIGVNHTSNTVNISQARGRKPKYDWEDFYRQIVLIANTPDGLPETQAELEREMAQWCIDNNWPSEPSESHIRSKISPIYQALTKAKK
jgi:hypothetical protein